ncbi:MAG: dihydrofolate reductase family protein [Saprospiraceae bacterium]|nr:dihydrofolate reductase family protein [Saprospiraceae bacterium]
MRKIIGAINMTMDGYCDHTAGIPDDEIHSHYSDLLKSSDTILYGRITFELMKFWREVVSHPTGNAATDEFGLIMNDITKVVFSHTLQDVGWDTARLAEQSLEQLVLELKNQEGSDVLIGSRSLIIQLLNLGLLDELQLCIHPVTIGSGLPFFEKLEKENFFKLNHTKIFGNGAIILYYTPTYTGFPDKVVLDD